MLDLAIKVENLGKKYIIGHQNEQRANTFRDLISSGASQAYKAAKSVFSQKYFVEGDVIEEFWALKNIDLEISKGDQVAIIGGNGAGKSTLLKILSRIVEPTEGEVEINGRIASLLEVGTGFHAELTGRENIFLNGAILGMKRSEIRQKFDQIVEFAEISQFLDTPVKRYSSGMYMRLAFAIAAHLESEILLIDEVLAVGDFKFQQKCLGKMEDIAKHQGRTILFVSHSMGIVSQLCPKAVYLKKGSIVAAGETRDVIGKYLNTGDQLLGYVAEDKKKHEVFIRSVQATDNLGKLQNSFNFDDHINIEVIICYNRYVPNLKAALMLQNNWGEYLSTIVEEVADQVGGNKNTEIKLQFRLEKNVIAPNAYAFCVALFITPEIVHDWVEMICPFKVIDTGTKMSAYEGINFGSYFMVDYSFKMQIS